MRTTVDIERGLLKRLREQAYRRGLSFKEYLNRMLQRSLEEPDSPRSRPYRCPTFHLGSTAAGVDLDRALALASALEDEESAREMHLRK